MPVHATYDVTTDRPHAVESPFELAAHRLMATWLERGRVTVGPDEFRQAAQFLRGTGVTLESLSTFEVRLVSERGRSTVLTREGAVMMALRSLVALDTQRTARTIARAA